MINKILVIIFMIMLFIFTVLESTNCQILYSTLAILYTLVEINKNQIEHYATLSRDQTRTVCKMDVLIGFIKTLLQKQRAEIIKELRDECVGEDAGYETDRNKKWKDTVYDSNSVRYGINEKREELIEIFNNKLK